MSVIRLRPAERRPSPDAMTLAQHLAELRRRTLVSLGAVLVTGVVTCVGYPLILHALEAPYCHVSASCKLYVTGPLDGLSLRLKIATYGALFLASPVLLWQFWRFVTPGLTTNEKRYAVPFVTASIVFFSGGVALAYLTFPHALAWLGSIGGPSLHQLYDPSQYLGLMAAMMAVFGVSFEFPVVLVALELAGVVTPVALARVRRWALVLMVVVAAIITPSGDPLSMLALAGPLYAFYELSIVAGKLLRR